MIEAGLDDVLRAIAALPPAEWLKASRYAYPVVNALHIVGLATLFGAIAALDIRILGLARRVPLGPLADYLPKVAAAGLVLAVLTGVALFSVQPVDYAGNTAFLLKVSLVLAGTLHAVLVHRRLSWERARSGGGSVSAGLRVSAVLSLAIWFSAIVAGRFIGFE